jgi:hypothetical protein
MAMEFRLLGPVWDQRDASRFMITLTFIDVDEVVRTEL